MKSEKSSRRRSADFGGGRRWSAAVGGGQRRSAAVGGAAVAAVGCVSASSLGRRAGSGAAPSVAADGCVAASSLVRAGRQQGQRVYPRHSLVRLG